MRREAEWDARELGDDHGDGGGVKRKMDVEMLNALSFNLAR